MAKATKLPSGNWRVNLYLGKVGGKEIRRSITGRTKKEAEQNAALYIAENHLDDTPMTVGEAVDKYIMDASVTLSPATIRGYRIIQRNQLSGIASYMADRIKQDELQGWVNAMAKKYAPKTVRNAYGLVTAAIKAVRPSFHVTIKLPVKDAELVVIPTEEDVQKMIDAANPNLRRCIMLAAFCGMRRGEICFLRYGDIKDGCVSIHGDVVKAADGTWKDKRHAKTDKSNRTVRVPAFVLNELGTGALDDKIFNCVPDAITNAFTRLMKRLGMRYHFHLLRHFFASALIAQGVPKDYVQALGGWEDGGSLDRVYTHILQSAENEYSSKVSDYFTGRFK